MKMSPYVTEDGKPIPLFDISLEGYKKIVEKIGLRKGLLELVSDTEYLVDMDVYDGAREVLEHFLRYHDSEEEALADYIESQYNIYAMNCTSDEFEEDGDFPLFNLFMSVIEKYNLNPEDFLAN